MGGIHTFVCKSTPPEEEGKVSESVILKALSYFSLALSFTRVKRQFQFFGEGIFILK
jgi:hypothetical protein